MVAGMGSDGLLNKDEALVEQVVELGEAARRLVGHGGLRIENRGSPKRTPLLIKE